MIWRAMVNHPNRSKKKLTEAERQKRFEDMAKEVGASEKSEDFDEAFKAITHENQLPKTAQK
jgi:hypothetical protein